MEKDDIILELSESIIQRKPEVLSESPDSRKPLNTSESY